MADCTIKRVCGGYIVTEKWKGFLGKNGDAETIKVFPVGEEDKILSELYGFIFENVLYDYGDCIQMALKVEEVINESNKNVNDTYINDEMFFDEFGCDYSNLKKENRRS